jgi:hypothetical protein
MQREAGVSSCQKPPRQPPSSAPNADAVNAAGSARRTRAAGVALRRFFSRSGDGGCGRNASAPGAGARPSAVKRAARGVDTPLSSAGGVRAPSAPSSDSEEHELLHVSAGVAGSGDRRAPRAGSAHSFRATTIGVRSYACGGYVVRALASCGVGGNVTRVEWIEDVHALNGSAGAGAGVWVVSACFRIGDGGCGWVRLREGMVVAGGMVVKGRRRRTGKFRDEGRRGRGL